MAERDHTAVARKRQATGTGFESELTLSHSQYEYAKNAKLWHHRPEAVRKKDGWIPAHGKVDYTGHACIITEPDSGKFGRGDGWRWRKCSIRDPHKAKRVIPIAFDAKVLGVKHLTYQHNQEQQHQLHSLKEAASAGVFAFLLVHSLECDRVFLIPIETHFVDLLSGRGVELFETRSRAEALPAGQKYFPLLPSIERNAPLIWDWIPLLQWAEPEITG